LLDFNGGQSCITIYVNQHDFFISKDRIEDASGIMHTPMWVCLPIMRDAILIEAPSANINRWESLPDPDATAPRAVSGLSLLYDEIRVTVDQEGRIITAVFPNPPVVMQVFLQRVFAQVVGSEPVLSRTACSDADRGCSDRFKLMSSGSSTLPPHPPLLPFFVSSTSRMRQLHP
jgi:hypothetical protein